MYLIYNFTFQKHSLIYLMSVYVYHFQHLNFSVELAVILVVFLGPKLRVGNFVIEIW